MKADVLQLVADLSQGQADLVVCGHYYDDLVTEMGLSAIPTCITATYLQSLSHVEEYFLPAGVIEVLAVGFNDRELPRSTIGEQWQFAPDSQTLLGDPVTWLAEDTIDRLRVLVLPTPSTDGPPIGGGSPLGTAVADALTLIYSEQREDVHPEEELWMALEILGREFARDSEHTDHTTAQIAHGLAQILRHLVEADVPVTER
jgi:hypothetical protein